MPFWKVLVWSETQTVSSRIWIQVTNSISYNVNQFVKRASLQINIQIMTMWFFFIISKERIEQTHIKSLATHNDLKFW